MNRAKNENGNMNLEAALIAPVFLVFILALISVIKISVANIALQSAVYETTKQISTHVYGAEQLYSAFKDSETGRSMLNYLQTTQLSSEWQQLLSLGGDNGFETGSGASIVQNKILHSLILTMLLDYTHSGRFGKLLKAEHLIITKALLPSIHDQSRPYVELEAQYEVRLAIPFLQKSIFIKKAAIERVWNGA